MCENVKLFQSDPRRFANVLQVLNMTARMHRGNALVAKTQDEAQAAEYLVLEYDDAIKALSGGQLQALDTNGRPLVKPSENRGADHAL